MRTRQRDVVGLAGEMRVLRAHAFVILRGDDSHLYVSGARQSVYGGVWRIG